MKGVALFVWLHMQLAYFRWTLASNEAYANDCIRDGIWWTTNTMREWQRQAEADRVRIARLEARLYPIVRCKS